MSKKNTFIKVTSAEHLRELIRSGKRHFFIQLNFGVRSSKEITLSGDDFDIFNGIDGTLETLTEEELFDRNFTNIGHAINCGAFWAE